MSRYYIQSRWSDSSSSAHSSPAHVSTTFYSSSESQPYQQCVCSDCQTAASDGFIGFQDSLDTRKSSEVDEYDQSGLSPEDASPFNLYCLSLMKQNIEAAKAYAPSLSSNDWFRCEHVFYDLCRFGLTTSVLYVMNNNSFKQHESRCLANGWRLAQVYSHHLLADRIMESGIQFNTSWELFLVNCCRRKHRTIKNNEDRTFVVSYILNGYSSGWLEVNPDYIDRAFSQACRVGNIAIIELFVEILGCDANTFVRLQLSGGYPITLSESVWKCISGYLVLVPNDLAPSDHAPSDSHTYESRRMISTPPSLNQRLGPPSDPRLRRRR